ncbi:MAG: aminotransferase class V-fold PLP-dependent enzyme [Nanohaloarchaea archaeon]|nr:aminotransferase class V-fold PLP-dependent enzyme [Candidatus Nanohaloarchaea archaeon]
MALNTDKIRENFPILNSSKPPVYFDSACMTLRPQQVIDKISEYYIKYPGCAGRSIHSIARKVTENYNGARLNIQKFFNAPTSEEVIFTRNTTEAINIVSCGLGLKKGDVVLTTDREHNSNLMPWIMLSEREGVNHKVVESKRDNTFDLERFEDMITRDVKLVSMVHTSNLDGYTIPAEKIIKIAHDYGALVMLDGAQSAPHTKVDLKKLDVDFFACSGHKMLGPSGIGMLYGKKDLLLRLNPYNVGGDMVIDTTYSDYKLSGLPERFEAGLQDYAGAIGFSAACDYIKGVGIENVSRHEQSLNKLMTEGVKDIPGLEIIGPADASSRGGILSFSVEGISPHDIVMLLDQSSSIMMRSGAHCVHSWFNAHNLPNGSARASVYIYNTKDEVKVFVDALGKVVDFFRKS